MSQVLTTVPLAQSTSGLSASFAYRKRIAITVSCVIAGLCGTLLCPPDVREGTPLDHDFDGLGWFLLALAMLLRLWASRHISGRKSKCLVTSGPYAMCRNPQYVGTLLIAVSQMLILKSWPFALACVLPIVLYALGVVPAEEHLLLERFGADYAEYRRQVPRWLPNWNAVNLQWGIPASGTAFWRECVRCSWWSLLPLASEFLADLRDLFWPIG